MSDRIPLFIVEDQATMLKNVVKLLATFPEVEVVGTAMSAEDALSALPLSGARVGLIDIELPGMDGLTLVGELKSASVTCELLVFTSFVDEQKVFAAMQRGAAGYLVKGGPTERLRAAIAAVDEGGTVIEPRLAKTFWQYFKGVEAPRQPESNLTEEEIELLKVVAKGLSNAEAAQVLGLQRRNVRTRLQKIYDKIGARSHVDAVVVALKRGLFSV